jgi:hypothetical protein
VIAVSDRETIRFEDDEGGRFDAVWSRSGKRLIVTVKRRGEWAQVELRPEQVDDLARFLSD